MVQNLRERFQREREDQMMDLPNGHEQRFLRRLNKELPKKSGSNWPFLWIAASSMLVVLSVAGYLKWSGSNENPIAVEDLSKKKDPPALTLGSLSPELKKIEDYYMANINYELGEILINEKDKALIDSYLKKLAELDEEYKRLEAELNKFGPNERLINALIENLQLRLRLLQKLKEKMNEQKMENNENRSTENIT